MQPYTKIILTILFGILPSFLAIYSSSYASDKIIFLASALIWLITTFIYSFFKANLKQIFLATTFHASIICYGLYYNPHWGRGFELAAVIISIFVGNQIATAKNKSIATSLLIGYCLFVVIAYQYIIPNYAFHKHFITTNTQVNSNVKLINLIGDTITLNDLKGKVG